jgi:hypothetical protein
MELGRIYARRSVFVDEMGTHTSLAPVYAYAPIGEPSLRSRGTSRQEHHALCLRAFTPRRDGTFYGS